MAAKREFKEWVECDMCGVTINTELSPNYQKTGIQADRNGLDRSKPYMYHSELELGDLCDGCREEVDRMIGLIVDMKKDLSL